MKSILKDTCYLDESKMTLIEELDTKYSRIWVTRYPTYHCQEQFPPNMSIEERILPRKIQETYWICRSYSRDY